MKRNLYSGLVTACSFIAVAQFLIAQTPPDAVHQPYKVVNAAKVGGAGGFDYIYADVDGRRLYIPRSNRVAVFDLDTLKSVGEIPGTNNVHDVAIDPQSHHGFSSSKPVVMWNTQTLATLKTIAVEGRPDGMLFDSPTQHVFVFSHAAPNVTVIDSKDGAIVGTIDLGGAPEQAVSDGRGHLYIDLEDKDSIAVVDANTLKVTAHYALGDHAREPAGLALDAKNHILFASCRNPALCVILNADDGKILASLPIGHGTDGTAFNPNTLEAFSSQHDGTLTVIKEISPTHFEVEQNVTTKAGARTCTLDTKTNRIFSVTVDRMPPPATPAEAGTAREHRGPMVPDSFTILVVGK